MICRCRGLLPPRPILGDSGPLQCSKKAKTECQGVPQVEHLGTAGPLRNNYAPKLLFRLGGDRAACQLCKSLRLSCRHPPRQALGETDDQALFRPDQNPEFARSFIPGQLPLSPMMVLPIGIENALDMPVQRSHDADARKHRRAVVLDDQE
jgi:hypothetical protein